MMILLNMMVNIKFFYAFFIIVLSHIDLIIDYLVKLFHYLFVIC